VAGRSRPDDIHFLVAGGALISAVFRRPWSAATWTELMTMCRIAEPLAGFMLSR
jgi:hypothetical protein